MRKGSSRSRLPWTGFVLLTLVSACGEPAADASADLDRLAGRIAELLDQSLMLVTALTPVIGYDRACAIARHAHQHRLSLREAALVLGEISAEEFDRWVRPDAMV